MKHLLAIILLATTFCTTHAADETDIASILRDMYHNKKKRMQPALLAAAQLRRKKASTMRVVKVKNDTKFTLAKDTGWKLKLTMDSHTTLRFNALPETDGHAYYVLLSDAPGYDLYLGDIFVFAQDSFDTQLVWVSHCDKFAPTGPIDYLCLVKKEVCKALVTMNFDHTGALTQTTAHGTHAEFVRQADGRYMQVSSGVLFETNEDGVLLPIA